MTNEPINDQQTQRKSFRNSMRDLKNLESDVNSALKDVKRMRKANQRKQMNASLAAVAEQMRQKGASEKSIELALKGAYEILKTRRNAASTPATATQADAEQTSALTEEALGILLSEVETQQVHWLWQQRIPLGKITILDGDPGMGKSLLAIHLAACISTGRPMPDGTPGRAGSVIVIAPEDGAGDTLKPRLEAAGGDPSKVLLLNMVECIDVKGVRVSDRPFSLSHDLNTLEAAIQQLKASLVIIDPLMAVLGHTIDASRDQDVREVFTPLAQLAERTNCAILLIRHLSKATSENLLYRGAGSIGIIAAARIGLIVAQYPFAPDQRLLATTKNNLSKKPSNLIYQIEENEQGIPYIHWLGENHDELATLLANTSLSIHRQDIIRILKESTTPLTPKEIAERTELDHITVRKIVRRMHDSREIASPSRGLYTAADHSS